MDTEQTGFVTFSDFLGACVEGVFDITEKHLLDAFDRFDVKNEGEIQVSQLSKLLER